MSTPIATVALVPREVFSTTKGALEALYERTTEPFRLVCVDGNSPPEVAEYLREQSIERGFTLLRSDRYLTPNEARNLAAAEAWRDPQTRHLVFVDNDALVSPGWLRSLVGCADETGAWVVGPAYYEHLPEQSRLHMYGGRCRIETDEEGRRTYVEVHALGHTPVSEIDQPLIRQPTELIEFHTVLITREGWDRVGPLDEGLTCNAEHGDLCLSVRGAGGEVWLEPEARVTYVPPRRLEPEDREFFFLRWSEARLRANHEHFIAKWNLDPKHYDRCRGREWVGEHRRLGLTSLGTLRRLVGAKWKRSIEKRLVAPIECFMNRRRYPYAQYGHRGRPLVQVVNRPEIRVAA